MNLPYFFLPDLAQGLNILDENTSRHVISVLRKKEGEALMVTDGNGRRATAIITEAHKKHCSISIQNIGQEQERKQIVSIGISPLKNTARFEWFLEKATEIGVSRIIPMLCARTEKEKFRTDRMQSILVSAMLQSQQVWLPQLSAPMMFAEVIKQDSDIKLISHCLEDHAKHNLSEFGSISRSKIILIGPEGDFTAAEIEEAIHAQFLPVSLGNTRLRTETAGMVAATLLCIH